MKKHIILCGVVAMLAMTSCTETHEKTETTTEKTTIVRDSVAPDGTRIKVTDQGVSIESKEGNKTNSVNVSKDSASIEISNPK